MYFYIHIPKCGGSSVRVWLRQMFKEGAYSDTSLLNHIPYSKEECEYLSTRYTHWMKSFSSHKLNLQCLDGVNATIFTTIRHPVERFLSRYFYFRSNGPSKCAAQYLTLGQFIEHELINKKCGPATNSLVYYLSGGMGLSWLLESIERNKCKIFTEPDLIPDWFDSNIPMGMSNTSNREPVSQETKDKILELSMEDYKFFHMINK